MPLSKLILAFGLLAFPSVADDPPVIGTPFISNELSINTDDANIKSFQHALSSHQGTFHKDVITFYGKMGNGPVWFFRGTLTQCGRIAVETLRHAAEEGLTPHDYEDAIQAASKPGNWEEAEILLTKRYLEFINHIRSGRVDPSRISRDIKFHSPKTHPVELLLDALQDKATACGKLRTMEPPLPQYAYLKKTLADYRALARKTVKWPKIKGTKAFKRGDTNPEVTTLREILRLHGDLPGDKSSDDSPEFDDELDKALRQFQQRHTIEPDGVAGGKTRDALNQPIDVLIRKVIYNMERLRWLPDEMGDRHIIVNVAGYEVQAYEKADLQLRIPAIVGRPSRRTPLFYAPLKNVIINPSWGVPYNILVHDKIPKILKDPGYISRSGFTVTDDSGNIVDPDQADWENEGTRYHLRQRPGAQNALGRLKFNIENPYTIYLHGTPDEKLFLKTSRPFSSGCIRLKEPTKLAAWVLNNEEKWSDDNIETAIQNGRTQTVKPEESIPVFFTYQTVWRGEDNLVHISNDPYGMDAKMDQVLNPRT